MYAEVVVDIPSERTKGIFHYSIPNKLKDRIKIGSAVLVPFGPRELTGYVVGFIGTPDVSHTKEIRKVYGDFSLPHEMMELAKWMSKYYTCSLGEAIAQMFPPMVRGGKARPKTKSFIELSISPEKARTLLEDKKIRAPRQGQTLEIILEKGPLMSRRQLNKEPGSTYSAIRALIQKGILTETQKEIRRNPFKGISQPSKPLPELTDAQGKAIDTVTSSLWTGSPKVFLLHGVTASGKTEVYIRIIEEVIAKGKSAIVLVPEISLTPQITQRFFERFGEIMAVLHSRLSQGERYDEWRRVEQGIAKIVIGARSAVFAPVQDLGIIIIDEEHENSYKQEESPRYHARDIACERARLSNAVCVLGSATPSVESYYRALHGDYKLLELPHRVEQRVMPKIEVIDMREELKAGNRSMFSRALTNQISERMQRKEQIILFLNRRGYSTFVLCRECGHSMRCPECDVSLTYHATSRIIRCHYCDYEEPVPSICPNCKGRYIKYFGAGTQRVEEEVKRLFPNARTIRMDTDTTRRKGAHERIVSEFQKGKYDVLIGTQMVAKGLDFPNVTLVGVISADTCLNIPDFKSGERTFQLLTQVAGRAGRGDKSGYVIVQTYTPEHYAIRYGESYDYKSFYGKEIGHRKEGCYPPFSSLILIVVSGKCLSTVEKYIYRLAYSINKYVKSFDKWKEAKILGPAPCTMAKVKGMNRWQILLKISPDSEFKNNAEPIEAILGICPPPSYDIIVQVDVNPGGMS